MRVVKRGNLIRCAFDACAAKHALTDEQAEDMNKGMTAQITCEACNKRYWAELKHGSFKTGVFTE